MSNYRQLEKVVNETSYDVLVVGAGAYGVPLGSVAKSRNKVAIVMGGSVGPFFGIKGRRFDDRKEYKSFFYNDCWLRTPMPPGGDKVEKGAYWRT